MGWARHGMIVVSREDDGEDDLEGIVARHSALPARAGARSDRPRPGGAPGDHPLRVSRGGNGTGRERRRAGGGAAPPA